jgi:hypothetical protein
MDLVYQAIHAALLPVRLDEVPQFLEVFLEHIGHRNEHLRPKQIAVFQAQLKPQPLRGVHPLARAA